MDKLIFEEKNTKRIELINGNLIYFLINDDVVVYVGQTKNGLQRPFSHYDKIYNRIEILECDKEDLNKLEHEYMVKYKPIHNKELNKEYTYSLKRVKDIVRLKSFQKDYNLRDLRKDLRNLDIDIKTDFTNSNGYIDVEDLGFLIEAICGATYE